MRFSYSSPRFSYVSDLILIRFSYTSISVLIQFECGFVSIPIRYRCNADVILTWYWNHSGEILSWFWRDSHLIRLNVVGPKPVRLNALLKNPFAFQYNNLPTEYREQNSILIHFSYNSDSILIRFECDIDPIRMRYWFDSDAIKMSFKCVSFQTHNDFEAILVGFFLCCWRDSHMTSHSIRESKIRFWYDSYTTPVRFRMRFWSDSYAIHVPFKWDFGMISERFWWNSFMILTWF